MLDTTHLTWVLLMHLLIISGSSCSQKNLIFSKSFGKEVNIAFEELKRRAMLSEKKQSVTIKMLSDF